MPCFGIITDSTVGDLMETRALTFMPGTVAVADGATTMQRPGAGTPKERHFVTRMPNDSRVGTFADAGKPAIWTARICMPPRHYLNLRSRFGWSLPHLVPLL